MPNLKTALATTLLAVGVALVSAGAQAAYVEAPQATLAQSFTGTVREAAGALPALRDERSFASASEGAAKAESVAPELTVVAPPIPEPETYALMLAGLGALGWIKRRRSAAQQAR